MQLVALGEGVHDLLDDHFRRRGAGGDAEALDALEHASSRCRLARCTSTATGQPSRSATSRSRCEFDEFGAPTTISASTTGATFFTASWRLVVA